MAAEATTSAPAGSGPPGGAPAAAPIIGRAAPGPPPADHPTPGRTPTASARGAGPSLGSGHRGLTTRGRCLLAGGIAACLCGVILDERDLLRVGLLATLLPLVAWAITATRGTTLSAAHHITPARLSPGMTGTVSLVITNDGSSRTRPIELLEPGTPDLTSGAHCLIPALAGGRAAVTNYPVVAQRRGQFVLGPPVVRLGDPFGTWEDNRTLPVLTQILVVPTVVLLQGSPTSGGSLSAASGRARQGTIGGDPDIGVRHYQRGDDIRTVHWRATARYDDLMVRLTEPVSHGGATILLDHRLRAHNGSGVDASLEVAVSMAASVALHLLGDDHHVRLVSHTAKLLAGGHDIADDVLASLAMVTTDMASDIAPAALTSSGLLIAVLGRMDEHTTSLIIAARRRSGNAIALLLATADWDGPIPVFDPVAALTAAGWRVVTVHRGDDLAQVWRRACSSDDGYFALGQARAGR